MTDIKWTTPINTGIAIAEIQWKRELQIARMIHSSGGKAIPSIHGIKLDTL